ncbi:DNA repair protein RadC [Neobacillus niacini]|nr:DNA repair protein RadC [Neobacillus niacini]
MLVLSVMKCAILNNAASIIVSHQHPSGDPTPSREDIEVTKRLAEAGKIIGIEVLDHVIVTHTGKHVSLKEKGYL